MRARHAAVAAALAVFPAWGACVWDAGQVKPDDMSKAQHEEEARREASAAQRDRARYDPDAVTTRGAGRETVEFPFNPTAAHRDAALMHERHADQHASAASALAEFEDEQCAGITPTQRNACPFLPGFVARTEEIPDGVRLVMLAGVNPDPMVRVMRCHAAFSRTLHVLQDECAPYVAGVTVEKTADGRAIDLKAAAAQVPELRRRAVEQVGGP